MFNRNRRDFLAMAGLAMLSFGSGACGQKTQQAKPNVLFIAVDDLNDWIGCLGGHPDSRTPNIDRLAQRGVLFTHAYCAAPACGPSRAAVMTGIRPATSGVYTNNQPFRLSPVLANAVTLPQYFMAHGYSAKGSGKIYHGIHPDPDSWDEYWPSKLQSRPPDPMPPSTHVRGIPQAAHFDWEPLGEPPEAMGDWQVAGWVTGQIGRAHDKPFFLACGFYRPHLPWYVPQQYFDQYPLDSIALPEVNDNDLDDIPPAGRKVAKPQGDHTKVLKYGQWRKAVQGYLASIAFADECVGRVLDALDASPHRDNTVIVLWSDHGWHLGEKLHWRKFALWEEATHNVLMFSVPGRTAPGGRCDTPVNLLDIYPTLVDLCGLEPKPDLEGENLTPHLLNPNAVRDRASLTTLAQNTHSVRTKQYRYIRYADGSEELYDHAVDPLEWNNLAADSALSDVKAELASSFPNTNSEPSRVETREEQEKRMRDLGIALP